MTRPAWTVWGVAELSCWIGHFPSRRPTGRDAEECLEAHERCGIRHIVWNLGRSVLAYHSGLPEATCYGRQPNLRLDECDERTRQLMTMLRDRCQLRAALEYGRQKGLVIYGRLCMNRHYGPASLHCSEFARTHPDWFEARKDGWLDSSRVCYAIPEYRAERVAILCEAAEIGCAGLCLDFCRQPPMVRYHPSLTREYRHCFGVDAATLSGQDEPAFLDWCQWRASAVTQLLRNLRAALDPIRQRFGRDVPVRARIPNDGFRANLIAGLDVRAWAQDRLVDELSLSELHWLDGYGDWDDRPYIELGRANGIPVYASSSCLPVQAGGWGGRVNPDGVNPVVLAQRTLRSMEAGAQGISLYQSDTGVQWPDLPEALAAMNDEAALRALLSDSTWLARFPVTETNRCFGIDNHSKPDPQQRMHCRGSAEAMAV